MHMTARNKRVNSTNVFGYITGSVEPGANRACVKSPHPMNMNQTSFPGESEQVWSRGRCSQHVARPNLTPGSARVIAYQSLRFTHTLFEAFTLPPSCLP